MKVHHIGYAVKDINSAIKQFEVLGYTTGKITEDTVRNVNIVFLNNQNECIELISPLNGNSESPVDKILKTTGACPYHICYQAESIEKAQSELGKDWIMIKKPEIAPAINNCKVAFFYNKHVGLIEIVEGKLQQDFEVL